MQFLSSLQLRYIQTRVVCTHSAKDVYKLLQIKKRIASFTLLPFWGVNFTPLAMSTTIVPARLFYGNEPTSNSAIVIDWIYPIIVPPHIIVKFI